MTVALALDGLITFLLAMTIGYCIVLNRRLADLRAGQAEFVALIERFNTAAERAEAGLARLRAAGDDSGPAVDEHIEAARALRDDLGFLIERGSRLADRLASAPGARSAPSGRPARPAAEGSVKGHGASAGVHEAEETPRSRVEDELVAALGAEREE